MEYRQRLNHFTATRTWTLDEMGVNWDDDNGESGHVAYSAISQVRLRFEPSRAERRRFTMRFLAGQDYVITNINYRGMWDFIDQSKQFLQFVKTFHENLHRVNLNVSYQGGSTKAAYIGNWALTLFILLMLGVAAFFFISIGMVWIAFVKAILILFYMPTLAKLLTRNRPHSYDPNNIPENILPE